jgi:16S rRNA (guanine527-N7)-methyltransferase
VKHYLDLRLVCQREGLFWDEEAGRRLQEYVQRLLEWNRKVNLVSRKDEENIWGAHILHSLSLLFVVDLAQGLSVLDLGTGGGLPGVPLAIVRPDLRFTLLDSTRKKVAAVEEMVEGLGLGNVRVEWKRAEDLAHGVRFDVVVARGVAPLSDLVTWSVRLLDSRSPAGELICYKGGDLAEEIRDARIRVGLRGEEVIPLVFWGSAEAGLEDKKIVRIHPTQF